MKRYQQKMKISFILFCLISSATCESGSQLNISEWYEDMIRLGAFKGDLNSDQLKVKSAVENIIKSSKKSTKMFNQERLLAYEKILNVNIYIDLDDGDETELNDDEMEFSSDENTVGQEILKDQLTKTNVNSDKEKPDKNTLLKSSTTIKSRNNSAENLTDFKEAKTLLSPKQTKNKTKETLKGEEKTNERKQTNQIETTLKKTFVGTKSKSTLKTSVRYSSQICYSNVSSHLDVFYTHEKNKPNKHFQRQKDLNNKSKKPGWFFQKNKTISRLPNNSKMSKGFKNSNRFKSKYKIKNDTLRICLRSLNCYKVCRYFFEFQMCIPGFNWIQTNSSKNNSFSVQWEVFPRKQNSKNDFIKIPFNGVEKNLQKDNVKKNEKDKDVGKISAQNGKNKEDFIGNKIKENLHASDGGQQNSLSPKSKQPNDSQNKMEKNPKKTTRNIGVNRVENGKESNVPIQETIEETTLEKLNQKLKDEKNFDIDIINKLIEEKSKEYLLKIHSLELAVIELDKEILKEHLSKSNDLLTLYETESQILNLQKEVKKLNQTYSTLEQENKVLKDNQQKNLKPKPDNEGQLTSQVEKNKIHTQTILIKKQQTKLADMTYLIHNQSNMLNKLHYRQEQTEEQNRILHNIVMNQSLLISEVMNKVHVLTEQLHKEWKRERSNDIQVSSVQLLQQLERWISNKEPVKNEKTDDDNNNNNNYNNNGNRKSQNKCKNKPRKPILKYSHSKVNVKQSKLQYMYLALLSKSCFIFDGKINQQYRPTLPESFNEFKSRLPTSLENKNKPTKETISSKIQDSPNSKTPLQNKQSNNLKLQEPKIIETKKDIPNGEEMKESFRDVNVKKENNSKDSREKNQTQIPNSDKMLPNQVAPSDENQSAKTPVGQKPESPVSQKPETSAGQKPETSVGQKPESPVGQKPETSVGQKPETSVGQKPETSVGQKPESPVGQKPETSVGQKPESPVGQKPETSVGQKPTKNSETPKKETNEKEINDKKFQLKDPLYVGVNQREPKDCYDLYIKGNSKNGAYNIKPVAGNKMIQVFCDMKNGGWTVIQRRQGGTTNFYQDWKVYKKGFGGVYGEHWLGNDNIHWLTNQDFYSLHVELVDWEKKKVTANYEYFMIDDDTNGYRLHVEGYNGDSGDSLTKHNLNKFSTRDVDNDLVTKQFGGSCAKRFSGAWWYYRCYASNLNGKFYRNGLVADKKFDGIAWKSWKKANYSLMKTEMKIIPKSKVKKDSKR